MLRSICCLALLHTLCAAAPEPKISNATKPLYDPVLWNGKMVFMTDKLARKLKVESETWHWTPYLKTRTRQEDNLILEVECPSGEGSMGSFPDGIFSEEQLRRGGVILYILLALCSFTLVAIVCNDYFLPTVEIICEKLQIPQNVAAATFMAVATSCPEFFVNVVSTFLTESDMGIGTIVGSAIFNSLGVAAIGGIAAVKPILIEQRPVTRDVIMYMLNVSVLVSIVWDGEVAWYEAMMLSLLYVVYFIVMFNSKTVFLLYDKSTRVICRNSRSMDLLHDNVTASATIGSKDNALARDADFSSTKPEILVNGLGPAIKSCAIESELEVAVMAASIWRYPCGQSVGSQAWFLLSWPIKFVLSITIPNPVKHERLYVASFLMCIVWIGGNSYIVSWTMTVIGHTFYIPDSVMGMTFMAFGSCLPEACAIFIMSRRGEGGMGVSNALGANSLAILFALGLPWLVRTLVLVGSGDANPVVLINSAGIDFVVGSLLVAVIALWITLFLGRFTLRRSLGVALICLYAAFVTFAILVEMGIIVDRGLAVC